ncbi:MAG: UDP-3-O-(3-hydroxymyristoyl)glucosamine N-acyltransferase [Candidatus Omnitrophota bacterium]|jgi:UDP-3-O-[3-hydroxymyristoyl] glucosamine N-acyltransferase
MQKTVRELAQLAGGTVVGEENLEVQGITNIENPLAGHITFAQDPKGLKALEATDIACIIVPRNIPASSKPLIQVDNPKLSWAKLLRVFYPAETYSLSVSDKASVAKTAKIGARVTIEPFAVISDGAAVGDDAVIRSYTYVGKNVEVGSRTVLQPGVMIYENCRIGSGVIIHSGSVIGADGFGYVHTANGQEKVPQVGNVIIEDDVEIGSCVTVDRAAVGSTRLCKGCKIDNLVQIAHNVIIGPHTVISAQTGISGSCKIGAHVTMGGNVGLGDHVEIGDFTMLGAGTGFGSGKKVPPKQVWFGRPGRPYEESRRQIAAQLRSAEMMDDIKILKKKVAELEKQLAKTPAE